MSRLEQWFNDNGWNDANAFQLQSIQDEEAHNEEYHTRIKYFHTDIKGSVVLPKDFHAWLFIGTEKEYDAKIKELNSMQQDGKVIGEFMYDTYQEWDAVWGKPVGKKSEKDKI